MNLRKTHHQDTATAGRRIRRGLFRGGARMHGEAQRRILFRRHLPRFELGHPGSGADDQGALRAGKRRAESPNGAPVDLAILLKFGEVMDESGVNHGI